MLDETQITNNSVILHQRDEGRWLHFEHPTAVYVIDRMDSVVPALDEIEKRVEAEGLFAAGFIAYDAGPAFNPSLTVKPGDGFPLLWFALYPAPRTIALPRQSPAVSADPSWDMDVDEASYNNAISRVKNYIAAGATYQVNYTFRLHTYLQRDSWQYFLQMIQAQGCTYGAYIKTERWIICSASPELFFRLKGRQLVSKPMKGTAARGLRQEDDLLLAGALRASEKDRAENVMIVDMVRNDLGRIAEVGSVHVSRLFELEKYDTVWQMTSTVECRTDASLCDIFAATFPPASITGAPKKRTMEIIAELENAPRRLYTGTVGFLAPNRTAQFNVAIRSVLIERHSNVAEYGVGGGIVWDSTDAGELEECRNKAKVLTRSKPDFSLLETILWQPDAGFFLLDYHLQRLADSADFFSRQINITAIRQQLEHIAGELQPVTHKVRLLLAEKGPAVLEAMPYVGNQGTYKLGIAKRPVNSRDRFLYHKTTNRQIYQELLQEVDGVNDVLLWNEKNEITESCIANVVLELDGKMVTPPVDSGLLAGVCRRCMLEHGKISEAVIHRDDLQRGTHLFLINSVRGMWEPTLLLQPRSRRTLT